MATSPRFEPSSAGRPVGRPAELLAELFDKHAAMVLGLCRSLLRDPHDGEDAAQQTFLSAYASLLGGARPRNPGGWLATIARNECRTRAQSRMRDPLPLGENRIAAPMVEAPAADVESLRVAVAQLPSQQRLAFVLREFSGLSYGELAAALGVTLPAVESLLFRARRQLRLSMRAAAAAAVSWPVAARECVVQLFAGSGDVSAPATLAKLGSLPLLAKLASVGAGAALMTAGAVAIVPVHHRPGREADSDVRTRVSRSRPTRRPLAVVAAAASHPVREAIQHSSLVVRHEPTRATTSHEQRSSRVSSGDGGDRSAPPVLSVAPRHESQDGHEASAPQQETSAAPIQTSDSGEGSGDVVRGGDGGSDGGSGGPVGGSGSNGGGDGGSAGTATSGN